MYLKQGREQMPGSKEILLAPDQPHEHFRRRRRLKVRIREHPGRRPSLPTMIPQQGADNIHKPLEIRHVAVAK